MSIRRSLALAGAAALTSSLVLSGAQGAMAVGTTGAPSAAAQQAGKGSHQSLDLSVNGVPGTFIAGGDARDFTFEIDNSTKHDFIFLPLLKFKNKADSLRAKDLKVQYQLPGGQWQAGSVAPDGSEDKDKSVLTLLGALGPDGNPTGDDLLVVNRGKSFSIKVRVSFTSEAPLGRAGVVPVVFSAELDDDTHEPVDQGRLSCDGVRGAGFVIKAGGGGKPSPTVSPTHTGKPSPTASTSPTASHSPTASTSPTATHSPTASTSPSASTSPTATATATATATTTPSTEPTTPSTSAPATTPATGAPSASASASTTAPAPGDGNGDTAGPIDFPVTVPTLPTPPLTPAVVAKAKAAADSGDKALAQTGGGDDTTAIAAAGGAVLLAGVGTLVVLRRRKSAQQG
ncbi:LPXTG cell wall anchor domain-containing protein [Kitasatospora sp. NPDC087314]|uniref:LPXTG cell wall anchor domain-containing protein n=1 Tax=Kitasatospora sp. NPDC087314 TaxID=3364068 RepID=UPI00380D6614